MFSLSSRGAFEKAQMSLVYSQHSTQHWRGEVKFSDFVSSNPKGKLQ